MAKCGCRIVGDLDIGINGIFSINVSTNSKISKGMDGDILEGPKEKTISISAYPFSPGGSSRTGCPIKINSQFKWTKIYSCEDDLYYYVYQNIGNISSLGDPPDTITFDHLVDQGIGYNASATAGPYSYYIGDRVSSAFSIEYDGIPISFDSANKEDMVVSLGNIASQAFLTSFNYTGGAGASYETVNYRFEANEDAKMLDGQVVQCDSINISYDVHGVASVSMIVYSNSKTLDVSRLPRLFGGVNFKIIGASCDLSSIPFSDCYKFNVSMVGIGE